MIYFKVNISVLLWYFPWLQMAVLFTIIFHCSLEHEQLQRQEAEDKNNQLLKKIDIDNKVHEQVSQYK